MKYNKSVTPTDPVILNGIVTHLFPQQSITTWVRESRILFEDFPPVTETEIQLTASRLKDKKAPGPDGIPNLIIKEAVNNCPTYIVNLFNSCFQYGSFPTIWKRQKLVLLPKGNKSPDDPSSYRPICLIDTFGKLLEAIVCSRLQVSVDTANGLSDAQYGFRKARSTIDAINVVVDTARKAIRAKSHKNDYCLVVTLDIKNAFNTANWQKTVCALQQLSIPQYLVAMIKDYFSNRVLLCETDEGQRIYTVTGGVPQGSVIGPLLWNVMYNGVLKLNLPGNAKIIGFADDIALVITASQTSEVTLVANACIRVVKSWLTSMGLALAEHKTEAVLISSRKNEEFVDIQVGGCIIKTKKQLKYLGVMIDNRLSFKYHLEYSKEKATKMCLSLCRIMPNTRGPKYLRRKVLAGVIKSILLYASPIWAECMKFKSYRQKISTVYRLSALRVCCAYRTVSDEAAFVIAAMIPIDLLAKESHSVYKKECSAIEARERSINEWQRRWAATTKGRWTHSLIPSVKPWLERKHGEIDFNITQMLSGHGPYKKYLHRLGLDSSPFCEYCIDDVQCPSHVYFDCPRFNYERSCLERQVNSVVRVENIIDLMLHSQANWGYVANYVKLVLLELHRDSQRSSVD